MSRCTPRGVVFEIATGTWVEGAVLLTVALSADHKRKPVITAIPINSTNANYNIYVSSVSKTQVVLSISSPAPADLTTSIHAVSTL